MTLLVLGIIVTILFICAGWFGREKREQDFMDKVNDIVDSKYEAEKQKTLKRMDHHK